MDKKKLLKSGTSIGLELAVSVFLFTFIGYKADQVLKTTPWCMVAGVFLGAVAGFWTVFKAILL